MPRVFKQMMGVSSGHAEAWIEAVRDAEETRRPFVAFQQEALLEFAAFMEREKGLSASTIRRHVAIVEMFNEFLARYTDVRSYAEVTVGMAGSQFRAWYKRKVLGGPRPDQIAATLPRFFQFLANEKGIVNEKVLNT